MKSYEVTSPRRDNRSVTILQRALTTERKAPTLDLLERIKYGPSNCRPTSGGPDACVAFMWRMDLRIFPPSYINPLDPSRVCVGATCHVPKIHPFKETPNPYARFLFVGVMVNTLALERQLSKQALNTWTRACTYPSTPFDLILRTNLA